jgi:hypothetical protein
MGGGSRRKGREKGSKKEGKGKEKGREGERVLRERNRTVSNT